MTETSKITAGRLSRAAVIYVRQSTPGQVAVNTESTARQYDLNSGRCRWLAPRCGPRDRRRPRCQWVLGGRPHRVRRAGRPSWPGSGRSRARPGCSRLARNNADWYRLLDLAGACDTLIGDADGIYHPALFNDRLLLGMKGTMSEAEPHILRARLEGGIRNKGPAASCVAACPSAGVGGGRWGDPLASR